MFDNLKDVLHGTLRCNGLGEGDRIYIRSHVPGDGYAARPFSEHGVAQKAKLLSCQTAV